MQIIFSAHHDNGHDNDKSKSESLNMLVLVYCYTSAPKQADLTQLVMVMGDLTIAAKRILNKEF